MDLKKELSGVAEVVAQIMGEQLKGQQHQIDKNKNNKIDAHDFAILRGEKKAVKKEEVEKIDETPKVDQGLSGKQKVAARAERGDNSPGFKIGNTTGGTWRGKDSPSPYKDSNVAKSGERKGMITKSAIQKTKDAIQSRLNKEEAELTQDEAEMLASLTQEEFDSLTEEEQDLFIEYFQPLDEISTNAAKNYLKKAVSSSSKLNQKSAKPGEAEAEKLNYSHENAPYETKQFQKFSKRRTGIRRAINKLASAHPDNKKLATTARQAFNKMHNANYRIGLDGAKNHPKDVEHIKKQHAIIHKSVHAMKEEIEQEEENFMTFSEMLAAYKEYGLAVIAEEPTEDEFNAEIKDQMNSFLGKKKQPKVAAPATKGVKDMPEEVEAKEEVIEERSLTEPEMKKKEEIVKSMKKKMSGFKERYGERAKSVIYGTATKIAKKD